MRSIIRKRNCLCALQTPVTEYAAVFEKLFASEIFVIV